MQKKTILSFVLFLQVAALISCKNNSAELNGFRRENDSLKKLLITTESFFAPPGKGPAAKYTEPVTMDDAQEMIDAYQDRPIKYLEQDNFYIEFNKLKAYMTYVSALAPQPGNPITDIQVIFARNAPTASGYRPLTFVFCAIRQNGHHELLNGTHVLEHCLPCPPPGNCRATTDLSK